MPGTEHQPGSGQNEHAPFEPVKGGGGGGGEPTGPAGGDLTGTYPNPEVGPEKITLAKLALTVQAQLLGPGKVLLEDLAEAVSTLLLGANRVITAYIKNEAVTEEKLSGAVVTKLNEKGAGKPEVEEQKPSEGVTANEKHKSAVPTRLCFLNITVQFKLAKTAAVVEIFVAGKLIAGPTTVAAPGTVEPNANFGVWVPPAAEYEIHVTLTEGALEGLPKVGTTVFK